MANSCGISTDHRNWFFSPKKKLATNAASDANCTQEKKWIQDQKKSLRKASLKKTSQDLLQLGAKVSTGLGLGITPKGWNKHQFSKKASPPTSDAWCSTVVLLDKTDVVFVGKHFFGVLNTTKHPKIRTLITCHTNIFVHIRSQGSTHLTLISLIVHCGIYSTFHMLTQKGPSNPGPKFVPIITTHTGVDKR